MQVPFLKMESMMPARKQNHTPAQNHYDSAEKRLKKGVLRPIFPAGLEIRPHPTQGGPPSQILSHAREDDDLCVTPPGLQILYASPRVSVPWRGRLPWAFMLLALRAASTTYVNWILHCKPLITGFHTITKFPCIPCVRWLKIGCEQGVRPKKTPSINR